MSSCQCGSGVNVRPDRLLNRCFLKMASLGQNPGGKNGYYPDSCNLLTLYVLRTVRKYKRKRIVEIG